MPRKVNYDIDYDDNEDGSDDYDLDVEESGGTPESIQKTKSPGIWRCSICTYDNDESLSVCDICGVMRKPLVDNGSERTVGICKDFGVSIMAKSLFASSHHQVPKMAVLVQEQNDESVTEMETYIGKIGNTRECFHECHKAFSTRSDYHINIAPFKFNVPSPDDVVSNGLRSSKMSFKGVSSSVTRKNTAINILSTSERSDSFSAKTPDCSQENMTEDYFVNEKGTQSSFKSSDNSSTIMKKGKQVTANDRKFSSNVKTYIQASDKRSSSSSALIPKRRDDSVDESSSSSANSIKAKSLTSSNMASDVRSAYSNFISAKGAKSHVQYKPDKWMLPDQGVDALTQLNLAIVGHVDSGKSTLSGRLLHLLGRITQKEMHKYEKEAKIQGKGSFAYAWALDESAEERERGITMTVGVAYFDSKRFHVVVLDSPGHKDFIPNMISGATQADAAILVIDASIGSFEAGIDSTKGQTKEHSQLIRSFGVDQIIVAVNKMDVVEYSKDRFDFIKLQLGTFLRSCGFKDSSMSWIPLSAISNQNLVTAPSDVHLLSWYHGPNLLEAIDSLQPPPRDFSKPLLMPICDVIKTPSLGQVSACGKLETGAFRTGSKVLVMPSGDIGTVRSLERDSQACAIARAGDNVTVSLQGIDGSHVTAGGVLCHPDFPVTVAKHLELKVLVLDFATTILIGSQLEVHVHHAKEAARVVKILFLLDPKTGKVTKKAPRCLTAKQTAVIEVVLHNPVCVENFSTSKALGRIFLRTLGRTAAVGIVTRIIQEQS